MAATTKEPKAISFFSLGGAGSHYPRTPSALPRGNSGVENPTEHDWPLVGDPPLDSSEQIRENLDDTWFDVPIFPICLHFVSFTMSASAIKNVVVVGASGNVGKSTLKALSEDGFQVTGLSRHSPLDTIPAGVKFITSDYSVSSFLDAFKGQDAVVSALSSTDPAALELQKSLIDAAIAAGVKIFIPSEYGVDTTDRSSPNFIPFLAGKIDILDYLRERQDKISWTALLTGSFFDWGLKIPGFGGWDIGARTVTIYDGGDIPYEATNLDQVGRAIAKSLKNPELTRNQHVYVNSFTVTQNEVLRALEKVTGEKFTVSQSTVEDLWQGGAAQVKEGQPLGMLGMVAGTIYGKGGLANYSVTKGLWNERIGLAQENPDETLQSLIARGE
ncbi:hypothetical protein F5883DRAFT_671003 [Diaporthe sp. PMI_573]|nr:hypothetical protein F5883DRAFT_671003 [Diaporthaceae sp. PMI_573]